MTKKRVLVTRPILESETIAGELIDLGYTPLIEPLLEIQSLDFNIVDQNKVQAIIFTSANAVRSVCRSRHTIEKTLPVFAVGPNTAALAREMGFTTVVAGDNGVKSLSSLVKSAGLDKNKLLLYFSGDHISSSLHLAGHNIKKIIVYRAKKARQLSAKCLMALDHNEIEYVLLFSSRTAEAFLDLVEMSGRTDKLAQIKALCISNAVLICVQKVQWLNVRAAKNPTRACMFHMLPDLK